MNNSETPIETGEVAFRRIFGNAGGLKILNTEITNSINNQIKQFDY